MGTTSHSAATKAALALGLFLTPPGNLSFTSPAMGQPIALAKAITHFLQHKRRTLSSTQEVIEREFRPDAVRKQYWTIYGEVGTCR